MKKRILLVDDESSICTFLSIALEDEFDVLSANNAQRLLLQMQHESLTPGSFLRENIR